MSPTSLSPPMPRSGTRSTTPVSSVVSDIYDRLILFVFKLIGVMFPTTNPFLERPAAAWIFAVAKICNEIAKTGARCSWLAAVVFHVSGVIAVEALLWVVIGQLSKFIIISVTILLVLVTLLCYYMDICKFLNISYQKIFGQEGLDTADQMAQED